MAGALNHAIATLTLSFFFLVCGDMIFARQPATYIVGGDDGWDLVIPMYTWPRGKKFYAGDILVFKYDPQTSNVVVVNRTGYETCKANEGSREYDSGNDRIPLAFGANYFIGTYNPDDCAAGLKMFINASSPPPF